MINNINNFLKSTYKISGYIAAIFLVLVAVFILTGISSRIFGFYIRGLAEYSGYSMGASSFFALAYTFYDKAHIRITLFIEKIESKKRRFAEIWCLSVGSFFSALAASIITNFRVGKSNLFHASLLTIIIFFGYHAAIS